jgi:hypothetical protein
MQYLFMIFTSWRLLSTSHDRKSTFFKSFCSWNFSFRTIFNYREYPNTSLHSISIEKWTKTKFFLVFYKIQLLILWLSSNEACLTIHMSCKLHYSRRKRKSDRWRWLYLLMRLCLRQALWELSMLLFMYKAKHRNM